MLYTCRQQQHAAVELWSSETLQFSSARVG